MKPEPLGSGFVYFCGIGLEQIQSQHAGGMLLPPVQKLVATFIFASGKNANRVLYPPCPAVGKFARAVNDRPYAGDGKRIGIARPVRREQESALRRGYGSFAALRMTEETW